MTTDRLNEMIKYYSVSVEFLTGIRDSAPKTAKADELDRVKNTLALFSDTVAALESYLKIIEKED